MKTGDVIAWRSDSFVGKVIRLRTVPSSVKKDSPFNINHVSSIIRLSEYEGSERRVYITEALEHGTVLNLLSKRLKTFKGNVYWFPLKQSWDIERKRIGERLLQFIGVEYDYKSIAEQIFGSVSVDVKQLFCSEYVHKSYGFSGKAPNPHELVCCDYFKEALKIL